MSECPLCRALKNEKDKILFQDDDVTILPTKDTYGHKKRIMVISNRHFSFITFDEETYLFRVFVNFCKEYFDEEPTFACNDHYDSELASVKDHWHLIATDWKGDDLERIMYRPHVAIRTNVKVEKT
jgi:hypothetical protein